MTGFEIVERLHGSARTCVQRVRRAGAEGTVILKSPSSSIPDQQDLSRYRAEFALLRQHAGIGMAEALELVEQSGQVQLVLQDIGGLALSRWLQQGALEWREALEITLEAARILAQAHPRGLLHGRISPAHIIWSGRPGGVQIVDWIGEAVGESHYRAPEQTGRINREVDQRADLYGLGATAWHMLTGQPPFSAHSDPLSLRHAQLAVALPPLSQLRPDLPAGLSTLMEGLLAKDPEQRYPDAQRLLEDLQKVLEQPGQQLPPVRPTLATHLPGREKHMEAMLEGLEQARRGEREVIALTGAAGVGKSTLARQLRPHAQATAGFFAQGRHQQFHHQQPHQALLEALGDLIDQLLGCPQTQIQPLQALLDGHGASLLPLLPKLKYLIAAQEDGFASLEGAGSRTRLALAALVRALARICRPLVLFLDDLQWGDEDSWQLLEFVGSDPDGGGLLLLLGWRGQARQPLRARELPLEPLNRSELGEWLAQICPGTSPEAAALLHRQTGGNPFFVQAVLRRLRSDLSQLAGLEMSDNVVDSLLAQMRQLPPETVRMLAVGACYGSTFLLEQLGESAEEVLQPALQLAMLEPYPGGFRFSHDRIQEAAYQLLDEEERAQTHLRIGRLLLQGDALLAAVEQLGKGLAAMQAAEERVDFARKSLLAARLASRSSAFELAFQLLNRARQAILPQGWSDHYELALAVMHEFNRVALAHGRHEQLEQGLSEAQTQARSFADEIPVWTVRLRLFIGQGKMPEAYQLSEQFLQRCGRSQPRSSDSRSMAWALLKTQLAIGRRRPEDLLELPEATDPILCGIQEIQTLATLSQARIHPEAIPLAILRDVRTVLADGVTASGAQCWTGYGLILCALFGQVELGRRYAELALRQVECLRRPDLLPRIATFAYFLVFPWSTPMAEVSRLLCDAVTKAFAVGDIEAAFFARTVADRVDYFSGVDLVTLTERVQLTQNALRHHQQQNGTAESAWLQEAMRALRHGPPLRWPPTKSQDDLLASVSDQVLKLHLALVFGDFRQAWEQVQQPPPLDNPSLSMLAFLYWTYAGIALLHGCEQGWCSWEEVAKTIGQCRKVLRKWSAHVPTRRWRLLWIEVSCKRARGGSANEILSEYDRVIELAKEAGFRQDAALICEFAASYCRRQERARLAAIYQQDALAFYKQWGALAKLEGPRQLPRDLDVETILRSARVLASEIRLPELLSSLVKLALENAGAQRGLLVLRQGEGWRLAVQALAQQVPEISDLELELEQPQASFPSTVLRYSARTRETVLVSQGAGQFAGDPYFASQQPLALICQPLEHGQRLVGLLYLENQLAATTFSATCVQVLQALSAQMAISLQNALHFQEVLAERDLRHQEALKNQSLTARRAALAAVLGMASHDLKNPLAAIRLWMSQLGPDPSPELLQITRKNVESACLRAQDLTALYLDTAALESGRNLELRLQTCEVDVLVESEIEFLLDSLAPEERMQACLEWDLPPLRARLDKERMRQVIANLVGNALKYCPPGTSIMVQLSQQEGSWELSVSDQGPGLAPELQAGLFQAFERRNDADIQGTGLGLWICRVIVEAHGGTIGVASPPEGGCRFWCRIPHSVLRNESFCD